MSIEWWKVGITLIGLPWSGKSALAKRIELPGWNYHDHDDNGLENPEIWLGKGWVARLLEQVWDRAFLRFEGNFTVQNYGRKNEWKPFILDTMIFASSGSLPRSKHAMDYIRERTFVVCLDMPIDTVLENIYKRPDGAGRIVWMNGWPNGEQPMHKTLEEELQYRKKLYQDNADAVFLYKWNQAIEERAREFQDFIEKVIQTSIPHSA